ncbi:thiolase family protein [Brachybacterium halotolerans]
MQAIALGAGELLVGESDVAERFGVARAEQDAFALESQRRARAAQGDRAVAEEIIPVTVRGHRGDVIIDADEHPREVTLEKLAGMRPVFREGGTVTAGNSSGINDGAAALVFTRASVARARGAPPIAELVDFTKVGIDPAIMGYGPKPAVDRLLARTGVDVADLDWIELNEAFAAQAVPVIRDLGLDESVVNPLGGAIAWGHPIGATGAIISARTIAGLRRTGGELGLATMCIGGGQAVASLWRAL